MLDDLIVYCLDNNYYRLIINCAVKDSDLKWITQQANTYAIEINEIKEMAILAVQGPLAIELVSKILPQHAEEINNCVHLKY